MNGIKFRQIQTYVTEGEEGDFRGKIQDDSYGKEELFQLQVFELHPLTEDDIDDANRENREPERREMTSEDAGEWFMGYVEDRECAEELLSSTIRILNAHRARKPRKR